MTRVKPLSGLNGKYEAAGWFSKASNVRTGHSSQARKENPSVSINNSTNQTVNAEVNWPSLISDVSFNTTAASWTLVLEQSHFSFPSHFCLAKLSGHSGPFSFTCANKSMVFYMYICQWLITNRLSSCPTTTQFNQLQMLHNLHIFVCFYNQVVRPKVNTVHQLHKQTKLTKCVHIQTLSWCFLSLWLWGTKFVWLCVFMHRIAVFVCKGIGLNL